MACKAPNFRDVNILVVGDVMLDRYWSGSTTKLSPDAPVQVVNVEQITESAGGAGNVAMNCATLGCNTTLVGVIGNDDAGKKVSQILTQAGVQALLQKSDQISTIVKIRVLSQSYHLIRLDFEQELNNFSQEQLVNDFTAALKMADIVILSDYNKGTLKDTRVFIDFARDACVPVYVDPKCKHWSAYRGVTLLKPNEREFIKMVGEFGSDKELIDLCQTQLNLFDIGAMLITRDKRGMTLVPRNKKATFYPSCTDTVIDATGAGDTVIATVAASFATEQDLEKSVKLANVAAGLSVRKEGAGLVTAAELMGEVSYSEWSAQTLTLAQLKVAISQARERREKVVMTNGCFDLIHYGHIGCLENARRLGDCLIVAVNDDASVARLKGPTRPILALKHRMAVLASLRTVNYVVSFSEDTPARLIKEIVPDVLVKGGDYQVNDIVGGDTVINNGGKVVIVDHIDGISTTKIEKIIRNEK